MSTSRAAPGFPHPTRRAVVVALLLALVALAVLYVVLPALAGLDETWQLLGSGSPAWLALAVLLELFSFGGYVVLFRAVLLRTDAPIGWRESYQITMAGLAATRLFATAGAGGVVLTVWALRHGGLDGRTVAARMTTFLVLMYGVFMLALVVGGVGLATGLFEGPAPRGLTIAPAAFGGLVIVLALAAAIVPRDLDHRLAARDGSRRWVRRVASVPALVSAGVRDALLLVRAREPGLAGAFAWWAFDIAVLWACFHAFGSPPPTAVLVMGYFVGMLGNLLPLPGGVGGVDGAMIAAFVGFGVGTGLAIVAVLSYRAIAFWLPTIPGAIAFLQLRRTVKEWDGTAI